jgi:hypothetical protein
MATGWPALASATTSSSSSTRRNLCWISVIPFASYEMVLDVQWLRTLGPILWDFAHARMSCWCDDHRVEWRGVDNPCTPAAINTMTTTDLMSALLRDFEDVFTILVGLPSSRRLNHRIHLLPGMAPIVVHPYRYPQLVKDELERQCHDMLRQGIIRSSMSAYSSPVLLVKKQDESWRFCVDYRALNVKTIRDMFPILVVDELLDELRGACFFSKLNLRSGYHQVLKDPTDVEKTALRMHHTHFEFLVIPFGLINAPATFQALMNDILHDFIWVFVLVFFDDILIFSDSWSTHLQHVRAILCRLCEHSLAMKRSKCSFDASMVAYLGHAISAEGVTMDADKVEAVRAWPTPRTVHTVHGFLGLTGYYRKFIRGYSDITAPLTQLLKRESFRWPPEATTAFNALKNALTSASVL